MSSLCTMHTHTYFYLPFSPFTISDHQTIHFACSSLHFIVYIRKFILFSYHLLLQTIFKNCLFDHFVSFWVFFRMKIVTAAVNHFSEVERCSSIINIFLTFWFLFEALLYFTSLNIFLLSYYFESTCFDFWLCHFLYYNNT